MFYTSVPKPIIATTTKINGMFVGIGDVDIKQWTPNDMCCDDIALLA